MENDNQVAEATNSDVAADIQVDDTEEVSTLRERLARAEEAQRQTLARAKRAEAAAKARTSTTNENDDVISKAELDLRLDGYSQEDARFILNNGGRKALENQNSHVAIALKAIREQREAERAASRVPDTSSMSEVERKYTPEMLKNMSVDELKKILPYA